MRLLPAHLCLMLVVLGVARAPAQPQAVPAGGERTMVFFAWDRPVIDNDAAASLDKVAVALVKTRPVRILVGGHADRSGPAPFNMRSGRARAEAVASYLAARGVPRNAMSVMSYGEARPLIPTPDGVREPQNRRVEIVWVAPGA